MVKCNNINTLRGGVDESPLGATVLAPIQRLRKNFAFTLAEVLITLGIIGVVAAMSIPSLISNFQKYITVNRLKHTYAIITQAVKLSEVDNGDINGWDMGTKEVYIDSESENFVKRYILPYVKNVYTCNEKKSYCKATQIKNLNGEDRDGRYKKLFTIILMNGVALRFDPRKDYVIIMADLNGPSGPNVRGKDNFSILIKKDVTINTAFINTQKAGIYFTGEGYTRAKLISNGYPHFLCSKQGDTYAGLYCGALIKLDGWKISKDYPW